MECNTFTIRTLVYQKLLTRALIPPDLKMAIKPCLWWLRLCNVPTAPLVDSKSEGLDRVFTKAWTI